LCILGLGLGLRLGELRLEQVELRPVRIDLGRVEAGIDLGKQVAGFDLVAGLDVDARADRPRQAAQQQGHGSDGEDPRSAPAWRRIGSGFTSSAACRENPSHVFSDRSLSGNRRASRACPRLEEDCT
jgi:hypothetical protein